MSLNSNVLDPSDVVRGLNPQGAKATENKDVYNTAGFKANETENKTPVTIMLEDFSQNIDGLTESGNSFIRSSYFSSEGYEDNIYTYFNANYSIEYDYDDRFGQKDIFNEAVSQDGGIKYANEDDDIIQAALNFAKADIACIEAAHEIAYGDKSIQGNLDPSETEDYVPNEIYWNNSGGVLSGMNINEESGLSPEEYASYMIAMDGLTKGKDGKTYFDENAVDGLISFDNQEVSRNFTGEEVLKETASKIYQENFYVEEKLNVFDVFLRDVFGIEPKSKKNS